MSSLLCTCLYDDGARMPSSLANRRVVSAANPPPLEEPLGRIHDLCLPVRPRSSGNAEATSSTQEDRYPVTSASSSSY